MATLTTRQLNRATLARQLLLARSEMGLVQAVEYLIGLQAQVSEGPYQGLWSRLAGFRHEHLTALIVDRTLVRATSLRSTLHLHTVDDLLGLRPHLQPVLDRMWKSAFGNRRFGGNDIKAVHRAGIKILDQGPLTGGQLGKALSEKFPDGEPLAKSVLLQVKEILIQIPPTRIWGSGHAPILTRAENWVPAPFQRKLDLDDLVLRYLRAYGPASVADMQSWSGLSRLGEVVERLTGRLVTHKAEDGRPLYDLADALLPHVEMPAPPRFLSDFDNVILGYDDRSRILGATDQKQLVAESRSYRAFTIDGFVAGNWSIKRARDAATLTIRPFRPLLKREQRALQAEGHAFLRFMEADAGSYDVAISAVD